VLDCGGKPLPLQLLERSGSKWENAIKVDFNETGCENDRCVELAQECYHYQWQALALTVLNLQTTQKVPLTPVCSL
jgi:hypothetical protein